MALEGGWLPGRTIEAGRLSATHMIGDKGKFWIRVFPHKSVTAKPLETRMGKGKREPEYYVAVVRPGMIICEVAGVSEETAREILNHIAHKMPLRTKLVKRGHAL
jgi:large subunit ribosomal protein L16